MKMFTRTGEISPCIFIKTLLTIAILTNTIPSFAQSLEPHGDKITRIAAEIQAEKSAHAFKNIPLFDTGDESLQTTYKSYVTEASYLKIDLDLLKNLQQTAPNFISINIPNTDWNIDLMKRTVLSEQFRLTNEKGENIHYPKGRAVFYWGMIEGQANSLAAFAIYEDRLTAILSDGTGNFELGKLSEERNDYVLYHTEDLLVRNQSDCNHEAALTIADEEKETIKNKAEKTCRRAIEVYIEADYQSCETLNYDPLAVADFVTSFFNVNALIYFNEEIPTLLSELKVWTTPDDYNKVEGTLGTLHDFSDAVETNFNGDIAHLISIQPTGTTSIAAIAWINALCASYEPAAHTAPTAFSEVFNNFDIFPSQSGTVSLFAHEMGHNCGSRHTHACVWGPEQNRALDNCSISEGTCGEGNFPPSSGGSIMSYCGTIDYVAGFWQEPGDKIRSTYRSAGCFKFGQEDLWIDAEAIEGGTYTATIQINSAGKVKDGAHVRFIAGQSITLEAGFTVGAGSEFIAMIGDADYCPELETCNVPVLTCVENVQGDFINALPNWETYCGKEALTGFRQVYEFTTTTTGDVTVMTTSVNNAVAAIMGACDDANSCIAYTPNIMANGVNYVTAKTLAAGTYYVVVSSEEEQDFELQLICPDELVNDEVIGRQLTDATHQHSFKNTALKITPNPFSKQATVSFELLETSDFRLTLYHMAGQKMQTLVDATNLPRGRQEFSLAGEYLEAGIYILVAMINGEKQSRKVVIEN